MVGDNTGQSVLDVLLYVLHNIRQTSEIGIAAIQWTANKSVCSKDSTINHQMLFKYFLLLSGGYYGFDFVTPPPQCVERFHHYRSN